MEGITMLILAEDVFAKVIEDKLAHLKSNLALIDMLFKGSSDNLRNDLKQYISSSDIEVVKGYRLIETHLPAFVIVLNSEQEGDGSLGSYLGDDEDEQVEYHGTQFRSQYRIEAWSNNAELTILLYHLLKWMFVSARDELANAGLNPQSIEGSGLEPIQTDIPDYIYRRALILNVTTEIQLESEYPLITEVIDESDFTK